MLYRAVRVSRNCAYFDAVGCQKSMENNFVSKYLTFAGQQRFFKSNSIMCPKGLNYVYIKFFMYMCIFWVQLEILFHHTISGVGESLYFNFCFHCPSLSSSVQGRLKFFANLTNLLFFLPRFCFYFYYDFF